MAKLRLLLLLLFLFSFGSMTGGVRIPPKYTAIFKRGVDFIIKEISREIRRAPQTVPSAPPTVPSAPPTVPSAPPTVPSAPPTVPSSPPPTVPRAPPPTVPSAPSTYVQTQLYANEGWFLMELAIGTPMLSYWAIMDTSSDLIWTQCQPCLQCFPQPTPLYDPSRSSTYTTLPCNSSQCQSLIGPYSCAPPAADCGYSYDYLGTQGVFGTETFTFGSAAVSGVVFGCGYNNSVDFDSSSGIVGMGRGSWSLVSQLGSRRFTYCLTPYGDNKTSPLLLGDMATLSAQAQSTPFIANPVSSPSYYYLSLQRITVGETELPIPSTTFPIAADGTGGLIIDSVSTLTMLVDPAYTELKRAFESQMNLSVADGSAYGLDICFAYGGEDVLVPNLVFHFEGADMNIPPDNYLLWDSSLSLLCVMVAKSNFNLSIFGNYMQQNMHVLYDLVGETLSFEAAQCDQLL